MLEHEILYFSMFLQQTGLQLVYSQVSMLIAGNESTSLRSRIKKWNEILPEFADVFRQQHQDVYAAVYDAAGLFSKVLDNPTNYGFKDNISSGNSEDCIWYDYLHPNSAMYKILANDLAKFLSIEEKQSAVKEW